MYCMLLFCKISYNTQYAILSAEEGGGVYEVNICHEKDEGIPHVVQRDEAVLPE